MTRRLDPTDPYRVTLHDDDTGFQYANLSTVLCTGRTHHEALAHIVDLTAHGHTPPAWELWTNLAALTADDDALRHALRTDPYIHAIAQIGKTQ